MFLVVSTHSGFRCGKMRKGFESIVAQILRPSISVSPTKKSLFSKRNIRGKTDHLERYDDDEGILWRERFSLIKGAAAAPVAALI